MSEALARALGAGSSMTVTISGQERQIRPLGIKELLEVERDCLARYKRQYLETFASNRDLLGDDWSRIVQEKMEQAARWDIESLPPKKACDVRTIVVTPSLKERIQTLFLSQREEKAGEETKPPQELTEEQIKRYTATAIDQGMLSTNDYQKLTGADPLQLPVGYVNWWITGSYEGRVTFVWACFKDQGVSREDVLEAMRGNMSLLIDLTREIESLSSPKMSNG